MRNLLAKYFTSQIEATKKEKPKVNTNTKADKLQENKAKDERRLVDGRGGGKFVKHEVIPSNWIILYGTKPGSKVSLDTKMIIDFINNIKIRTDKIQLKVEFPDVLDQMKTQDANFEMTTSNTIQKLNLF